MRAIYDLPTKGSGSSKLANRFIRKSMPHASLQRLITSTPPPPTKKNINKLNPLLIKLVSYLTTQMLLLL